MKNKKIILTLFTSLFLSVCLFLVKNYFSKPFNKNSKTLVINSKTFKIEQKIIYGENRPDEINTYEVKPGESVLDLLSRTKKIQVKEYSIGKMVVAIERLENGKDKKYWIYFINDQEAKIGANNYKLKIGEKVTWKFKAYEE
jgi:hypothetical protein